MSAIRDFMSYVKSQSSSAAYSAPAPSPTGAGKTAGPTDDTGLRAYDTVYVSPDGGETDEPFPEPDVEYDIAVHLRNTAKLPSGPCIVVFKLSGSKTWDAKVPFEDGLKAGEDVRAAAYYGKFDDGQECTLSACVYKESDLNTPISCAGEFGFKATKW